MIGGQGNLNRRALHRRVSEDEKNLQARGIIDDVLQVLGVADTPAPTTSTPAAVQKPTLAPGPVSVPATTTHAAAAPTTPAAPATSSTPNPETTPKALASSTTTTSPSKSPSTTPLTSTTPTATPTVAPTSPVSVVTTPKATVHTNIAGTTPSLSSTAAESPTSTAVASTGSSNTVSVVGGVFGGLVAVSILVAIGMYCMRRARRRATNKEFDVNFSNSAFPANSGARPPTIIESGIANRGPATYGTVSNGSQHRGNGYEQPFPPDASTPNSSAPLFPHDAFRAAPYTPTNGSSPSMAGASPSTYTTNPFSPVGTVSVHSNDQGSPFATQQQSAPSYDSSLEAGLKTPYSTMERQSVTPFQAAQYAEISRQLNLGPPSSPADSKAMEAFQDEDLNPPSTPAPVYSVTPSESESVPPEPFSSSPPVMAYGLANRTRIDSVPPMLPDPPRAFSPMVIDFASRTQGTLPVVVNSKDSPLSGAGMSYPTSAVVGDNVVAVPQSAVIAPTHAQLRGKQIEERNRPETMYTVYDPEDAYGGF